MFGDSEDDERMKNFILFIQKSAFFQFMIVYITPKIILKKLKKCGIVI